MVTKNNTANVSEEVNDHKRKRIELENKLK